MVSEKKWRNVTSSVWTKNANNFGPFKEYDTGIGKTQQHEELKNLFQQLDMV